MDIEILKIIGELHHPLGNRIMTFITYLGSGGFIWFVITFILLMRKKTRQVGLTLGLGLIFCFIFGKLCLKNIFKRLRPFHALDSIELMIEPPSGYSFPSSHAMTSFTSAFIIFFHNRKYGAFALVLAVLIGFSRIYLMVHYPSDVLGGAVVGYLFAVMAENIIKRIKERKGETL